MSILTETDRQTLRRKTDIVEVPVKAAAVIRAGYMVAVDATGYAIEGIAATDLIYLGRAEHAVDASELSDGEATVLVLKNHAFLYANSSADPVTQASFGKDCYIEDGETVAATDAAGTLSKAGRVVGIDEDGVWIE